MAWSKGFDRKITKLIRSALELGDRCFVLGDGFHRSRRPTYSMVTISFMSPYMPNAILLLQGQVPMLIWLRPQSHGAIQVTQQRVHVVAQFTIGLLRRPFGVRLA